MNAASRPSKAAKLLYPSFAGPTVLHAAAVIVAFGP
jgi:hypothetical protein